MNKKWLTSVILVVVVLTIIGSYLLWKTNSKSLTQYTQEETSPASSNYTNTSAGVVSSGINDQSTSTAIFTGYYTEIKGVYGEENIGPYDCDAFIVKKSDDPLFQFLANWAPGTVNSEGDMRLIISVNGIDTGIKNKITASTKINPVSITVQKIKFEAKGLMPCASVVNVLSVK